MTNEEVAHLRGLLKKATAEKEAQDLLLRDTREELARVRKALARSDYLERVVGEKIEAAQSYREKLALAVVENCDLRERGLNLALQVRLAKLNEPALLEKLADIEHERWSSWEKYREQRLLDCAAKNAADIGCTGPFEQQRRWKELRETPYADLEEISKESDRKEARKTLAAITAYLGSGGI